MHDHELIRKNAESSTQRIGCAAWRLFLLLVWAAWWGGLCFYAVVVVPIGTELIGSVEQGFITQRVTQWHNGLTAQVKSQSCDHVDQRNNTNGKPTEDAMNSTEAAS